MGKNQELSILLEKYFMNSFIKEYKKGTHITYLRKTFLNKYNLRDYHFNSKTKMYINDSEKTKYVKFGSCAGYDSIYYLDLEHTTEILKELKVI